MREEKSSTSEFRRPCEGGSTCVEVGPGVLVRDSKNPTGPMLGFTIAEWRAFVAAVKRDQFDI